MKEKDLYAALGLTRSASADDIKKAYRKLARKHHPDVNPGNKRSEERFKEISEANDILSDPEKRKLYDEFGMTGVQAGFDAGRAREYRDQSARWQEASRGGSSAGGFSGGSYTNFEDIFGDIFGAEARGRSQAQRGADIEAELEVDLLDAIRGTSTEFTIQRPVSCEVCNGSGVDTANTTACPDCGGKGQVNLGRGPLSMTRTCPRCGGSGRIGARPCPRCGGEGATMKSERLQVRIPPGVDNGSKVRVAGKGADGFGGAPPGDLFIRIRVRPHRILERRGDDLHMDLPLTVGEAVAGASVDVPTAHGGTVRVRVPANSQSGKQLRVKGQGVPHLKGTETGRGDLYLRLVVHVPDRTDDGITEAARALDAGYSANPRAQLRL
jgi:molecular chaperone DnaJ